MAERGISSSVFVGAACARGVGSAAIAGEPDTFKRKLLSALLITVGSFAVINLAFAAAGLIGALMGWLLPDGFAEDHSWYGPIPALVGYAALLFVTWKVLHSDLRTSVKAMFLPAPISATYLACALAFLWLPAVAWVLGIAVGLGLLTYMRRTHQPWEYVFALVLASIAMVSIGITGTEI